MKDFKTLKEKIQRGDASEEEVERFRQYIERVALEEMQRAIVDPPGHDRAEEWRGVQARIQEQESEQEEGTSRYLYLLGRVAAVVIAAALIGAFVVYFWRKETPQPLAASTIKMIQGKNHIKLADGTAVDLNEGSILSYSTDFGVTRERVVQLEGEAFFDVAHDPARPFIVRTGDITTRVLGTAFDVKAYRDQDVTVTVSRGKVRVGNEAWIFAELLPDQQLTYHRKSARTETRVLTAERVLDWKEDFLVLDDVTVGEALEKIADRFHVRVAFKDEAIRGCKVRIAFVHRESLDEMLDVLEVITRAQIQVHDSVISVTGGEPCV